MQSVRPLDHLVGSRKRRTIARVWRDRLTYLEPPALADLWDRAREVERRGLPGVLVETGCALGGSAIVLAAAKARERELRVYDVFGMIPAPSKADGADVLTRYDVISSGDAEGLDGDPYYGYEPNLAGKVASTFDRYSLPRFEHGVRLVQGLYHDTLHLDGPVALAHVDCDWYESVLVCLERIVPHLVPGGVLVIDDYDAWSGCRRAVDDYFGAGGGGEFDFERRERLHVVRRARAA